MNHIPDKLINRLSSIGITIELSLNYPWVYLDSVNGKSVTELFWADHGFTVTFLTTNSFTDRRKVFKTIRSYL